MCRIVMGHYLADPKHAGEARSASQLGPDLLTAEHRSRSLHIQIPMKDGKTKPI